MYYEFTSEVKTSESKGSNVGGPHGDRRGRKKDKSVRGCIVEVGVVSSNNEYRKCSPKARDTRRGGMISVGDG